MNTELMELRKAKAKRDEAELAYTAGKISAEQLHNARERFLKLEANSEGEPYTISPFNPRRFGRR